MALSSLRPQDLEMLVKRLSVPQYAGPNMAEVTTVGSPFVNRVHLANRYELPSFEPSPFDPFNPNRIGHMAGYEICIDPELRVPRMQVSAEFRRIQTPELVEKTQQWMSDFFGYHYPVHTISNKLVMHPEAYKQLQNKMRGINV